MSIQMDDPEDFVLLTSVTHVSGCTYSGSIKSSDKSGALLGGQISGGPSVGELINVIAIGIQMKLNVRELDMMQKASHPLINAAHQALTKLRASAR